MPFALLISALLLSPLSFAENMKAYIVNQKNQVVGTKQIRDLKLCGQSLGPALIAEGHIEDNGQLFLDCSDRMDQITPPSLFDFPLSEVRTLVNQGPTQNRIDLTIVGDGYTVAEKERFFQDAIKMTNDLFGDKTFSTYLPLFNVHAVFVASQESGIGDGRPKNTALKLYRHPRTRQAIMPGDSGAAHRATRLAPDTDYPILVANDPFYGGLGGQFAITSNAPLNITTVLRHELGHNFGRVGEEYDGGQVYSGANSSRSPNARWRYWAHAHGHELHAHKAELLHYSAPWKNLSRGSWKKEIKLPAGDGRLFVDFSSLGFDSKNDVKASVSGVPVNYDGAFNYDRNFYSFFADVQPGRHSIEFSETVKDGNNILSKVAIYSMPLSYPLEKDRIGAFVTYNGSGRVAGYRPTHDTCLMRDMSSKKFCDVCTENMWHNFLREVSLIDAVGTQGDRVVAQVIPLGQRIRLEWIDPQGNIVNELTNQVSWNATNKMRGRWTVRASFISPEVQMPNHQSWSVHTKKFQL